MVDFIHNNKDRYGVEAICRILPIAASTYYRALDLVEIQNIERNEIYMMSIMLNKLNEFGRKVQVDMVYVKVGKNWNVKAILLRAVQLLDWCKN